MEGFRYHQVRLRGLAPGLLLSNGQMADPAGWYAKRLEELRGKEAAGEEVERQRVRYHVTGRLYLDAEKRVVLPAEMLSSAFRKGASAVSLRSVGCLIVPCSLSKFHVLRRSIKVILVFLGFTLPRLVSSSLVIIMTAPLRSAMSRLAPRRSVKLRSAPSRLALLRSASFTAPASKLSDYLGGSAVQRDAET
jgi:hypothetical protein